MATGDAAGAAGLYVVPPTKDFRLGYDDINRRGDELANHMVNGTHPFTKITGTITEAQLGNNTVSTVKLKDNAVTTAKIADLAVTGPKIAPNAVSTTKILDDAVTAAKIADGAVTTDQIGPLAVGTAEIADLAVTTAKIAATAVTTAKIGNAAVTSTQLAALAVGTAKIADLAVTSAKIANATINADKLAGTLSRTGTWNIEADTLTLRDASNTDKLTLGGAFTLQTNQSGTVRADVDLTLHAGGITTVDADVKVEINSDGPIAIDAGDAMTLSTGGTANLIVDAAGILALRGADSEILVNATGVNSETIYSSTTSAAANVTIDATGYLHRSTSSRRYKVDIRAAARMPKVLDIVPRTFADKNDPSRHRTFGAIAEDLVDLGLDALVVRDINGQPEAIAYDRVALALIPEVRVLRDKLAALTLRVTALERSH